MRVLVTRPEPGAGRTAKRLAAAGHEAIVLPLTRIVPLNVTAPDPATVDAVALTSVNAVRHAPSPLLWGLAGKPAFAVGEATAAAAREAGLGPVMVGMDDGVALAAPMGAGLKSGSRILYLAGRTRSPALERALAESGFEVVVLDVYNTADVDYGEAEAEGALRGLPVDAALVFSRNGARALKRIMLRPLVAASFQDTVFLALSAPVAAELDLTGARVRAALSPTEDALFALLDEAAGTERARRRF